MDRPNKSNLEKNFWNYEQAEFLHNLHNAIGSDICDLVRCFSCFLILKAFIISFCQLAV